jgi:uncharacterized protein YneR
MPGFIVPLDIRELGAPEQKSQDDYRPVPSSDRGNEAYRDRGALGFYHEEKPYKTPDEVKFFSGFGGTEADLERGWCEPLITEHPAYQLQSYKDRYSQPMESDVTPGNVDMMEDDWAFRERNRRSKGFLPRPRIPVERG